jgi:hypothetical protein
MRELNAYAAQNPGTPLGIMYATLGTRISDLVRRLAEVENVGLHEDVSRRVKAASPDELQAAPAPLPECCDPSAPIVQCCVCGKPVHTCEADNASGPNNHVCPAHPEGAEREGGQWVCSEDCDEAASALELLRDEGFRDDADIVTLFITTQARRLAEVESSVGVVQFRRLQAQLAAREAECEELRSRTQRAEQMWDKLAKLVNPPGALAALESAEAERDGYKARCEEMEAVREAANGLLIDCVDGCSEDDLGKSCSCLSAALAATEVK